MGFRGQGDLAFWHSDPAFDTDEKRGAFISRVIRRQMEIVREYATDAHFCTNLYGEMMALYRQGYLQVPEEVVKVWGDNGFGRMVSRRQGRNNPRTDAMPAPDEPGRNGVYYHVSFYDLQAANHITMLQVPPRVVAQELKDVLAQGGNEYWIINVGCIRPHAFFMIGLISRLWQDGSCDVQTAAEDFASRYYGTADASLLTDFAKAAVPYGPNADDLSGDQFYHFTLRSLAHAWILASNATACPFLAGADQPSFEAQVSYRRSGTARALPPGEIISRKSKGRLSPYPRKNAQRLRDTLSCMAAIHQCG